MRRANDSSGRIRRDASLCVIAAVVAAAAAPARAQTPAGTPITNTATLTYAAADGSTPALPSNTVTLQTVEILDVTIAADAPTRTTRGNETVAVGFVVTNTGNGQQDYTLAVSSAAAGVSVERFAIDRDGDGVYSATADQTLAPGAALSLAPGQVVRVFVLVDAAQIGGGTVITARVAARIGSGPTGTVFTAAGAGGGDAIVGTTGASASAATHLSPTPDLPMLTKTQGVFAPDGSTRVIPGAIVTYRLVATFVAATRGVVIDDPIPAGTAYVPGTLRLDDAPLSDADDEDAGSATGGTAGAIRVALGDISGAGRRTVQFSVKIQ